MTDPYELPSGVLRNRLGLREQDELHSAEADIAMARLVPLRANDIPGDYDLKHLQAFHRFIFGPVYDWAGELRTVDISKGEVFCRCLHLESFAAEIFGNLHRRDRLQGLDRSAFIQGLADFYADLNALHPFREGNGRTQRAFIQQLARSAGHSLSWSGLDADENEAASIASFRGEQGPLIALLDKHLSRDR
ncbi:MAG: cell filamentation protein Fic [Nonomuraea sp.]|nr:cell filamentation protein Fic [Nonomuraea sp.]